MKHQHHHTAIFFSAAAALLLVLLPLSARAAAAPAPLLAKSACDTSCGNISVWYPFGIGPSYCYHSPGFNLTCDRSSNPPRLLLGDGTLQVSQLYNSQVEVVYTGELNGTLGGGLSDSGPYTVSDVNNLILVGCNARATLRNGDMIMSSCASFCQNGDDSYIPSFRESRMRCSGWGCCQAPIVVNREVLAGSGQLVPITSYDVELESFGWNRSDGRARVIVASNGWFDALSGSRQKKHSIQAPFVLEWEIIIDSHDNGTQGLQSSAGCARACRSNHTICTQGQRGGYLCSCRRGYQGNPYITKGCQDIDECKRSEHYGCFGQCTNTVGSFQCHCQQGTSGDPNTRGGCFNFLIGAGASASNCSTSCGNMSVPYPFGIGPPKCYLPGFNLTCDTSRDPPQLMLGTLRVVDISLPNTTLRVINTDQLLLQVCGARIGMRLTHLWMGHGDTVPYSLSTNNELIVTGCSVQAGLSVGDSNRAILGGCSSFCSANENGTFDAASAAGIDDDYCYGLGCCQARISMSKNGMPSEFWFKSLQICASDKEYPDAYTFIAEEGWFNKRRVFSQLPRSSWRENQGAILHVPLGLDWEVLQLQSSGLGLKTNGSSQQYIKCPGICKSKNSLCKPRIRGYSCHCNTGYDGNPYLVEGCKGGGRRKFKGMSIIIGIAAGSGLVLLFLTGMFIKKKLKHRRSQMLKRKFFQQNRGQLLQQLVSQSAGIAERMIITLEELEKATHCFDKDLIVGGGGHGIVYKGILSNQHIVAIKKPKKVIQKEIDGFINEVAILS
ncbi:wall-associated receptor kinase 3-like [Hordeum vulgare]|nr:wall-associated receptor kinase 3-like [Hordeum vulgare]